MINVPIAYYLYTMLIIDFQYRVFIAWCCVWCMYLQLITHLLPNQLVNSNSCTPSTHTTTHTLTTSSLSSLTQRVALHCHPHPSDSSLTGLRMRVLSTTPSTTIGHLVKHLTVRNSLQRKERTGKHYVRCAIPIIFSPVIPQKLI